VDGHPIQRMVEAIDPPVLRDLTTAFSRWSSMEARPTRSARPPSCAPIESLSIRTAWGRSWRPPVRAGLRIAALMEYLDEEVESRGGILLEEDGRLVLRFAGVTFRPCSR
jgi:hypothetical protein